MQAKLSHSSKPNYGRATNVRNRNARVGHAVAASLLALLSLVASDAWAPSFGRPVYRPPEPPARPYRPAESDIYRAPTESAGAEAIKSPWAKSSSPLLETTHNADGSKRAAFWKSITDSLGSPTTNISSAYILVRIVDKGVVITTNFLQPGYKDAPVLLLNHEDLSNADVFGEAVTKLTGSTKLVDTTSLKIVLDKDPSSPEFAKLFNKDEQTFRFSTASFSHAELYLKGSTSVFALERIDRPKPPPRWAAKLNKCCVKTGVPPDIEGWAEFGRVPFNRKRAQIVSLFSDSRTSEMLAGLNSKQNFRHPNEIKGDPLEAIRKLVDEGDKSAPIIVIGHTEGSSFRVEGSQDYAVSFEALTQIAKVANRPVFFVGCYTAEHFAMADKTILDYPPIGTLNLIYPREVVPKILRALNESSSMRDFTEKLSDETLDIWVSNNFLRNVNDGAARTVRAPIYKRLRDGSKSIVGFIFMYIPCGLFGACK